jgi:isoleucyl-tRNA synthetase
MFKEVEKISFAQREEKVLKFWDENKIFEKTTEQRENAPRFTFYDGPPFATGLPHYGHILAGTIKDVIPRYKTMKGFNVPRRFGWDCHGLPIESEIEKTQKLSGAASIEAYGIAKFNEDCRRVVLRYTEEWKATVRRMARWVDLDGAYKTMDRPYMESVWWVFKNLHDKGFIYKGFKVMPYSARLGTTLSNFEAGENYKEVDDPSVIVAFPLEDDPEVSLLAWTTTPWTLVSNLALTIGEEVDYVLIEHKADHKRYILAKALLRSVFKEGEYAIVKGVPVDELKGKRYIPLFPHFEDRKEKGAFQILTGNFITLQEGTGIVHTAPAFGEEDFNVCQEAKIDIVCPVDNNGRFTKEVPEFEGKFVKEADKGICKMIKEKGRLLKQGTIRHRYPYCYRSDTPLIYKAVETWFISVEKIKDAMVKNNNEIHWTPEYIKHGRFGNWLENARDWNFSRKRYWGTPIPLWVSDDGDSLVISSVKELEELAGKKFPDIHRHFIDDVVIEKDGKKFRRISEVFDCWFESGSMPYAQKHYPFENETAFTSEFPADFIAEGLDQTRGWFYTLTVLSTALFNKPAFKNVIVNGIILAEDGMKMSKRLQNYPEPKIVIDKYGADAIRLYLLHSPAVRADDLKFKETGVELVLRQVLIPLWSVFDGFFVTYARIFDWSPKKGEEPKPEVLIDRWILSLLQKLIIDVEEGMGQFDLSKAVEPFIGFVDQLTNWYIRRCRRRFYTDKDVEDRNQAFNTLYYVLKTLSQIAAPFIPLFSESIYQHLKFDEDPESVHLCEFPKVKENLRDKNLEEEMSSMRSLCSLGHSLRKEHMLKVRQPLRKITIACPNEKTSQFFQKESWLISEELNVKEVLTTKDDSALVDIFVKPNFPVLGKKVGRNMREVQSEISKLESDQLIDVFNRRDVSIFVEEEEVLLKPEDLVIRKVVKEGLAASHHKDLTVSLDVYLDEELLCEGMARELINKMQRLRKESGFEVTDRIEIQMESTSLVKEAFEAHKDLILSEVLGEKLEFIACNGNEVDLNGEKAVISLKVAKK